MKKIFAIGLIGVLFSSTLFGEWALIELEELVRESDLIVVGTLHSATEDSYGIGLGQIKVEEIIAGKAKSLEGNWLNVGDNLRINWADNWACAQGMHQRRIGERGVWLLDVEDDGTVSAAYPGKFTQLEKLAEIRQVLRKTKAKNSTFVDVAAGQKKNVELGVSVPLAEEIKVVDVSPRSDFSLARGFLALVIAMGLYWIFYWSRFRIR